MKAALCFLFILAFGDLTNGRSIFDWNKSPSRGLSDVEKRKPKGKPILGNPDSGGDEESLNSDIISLSYAVSELQSALQSASSSEGNLWMTVSSMLQTLVQSFGEDSAAFQQLYSYLVAKEIAALGLDGSQFYDDMPSEDIQVADDMSSEDSQAADDMPSDDSSDNDVPSERKSPTGSPTLAEIRISVEQVSQMIKSQDASRQILVFSISAADTTLNLYNSAKGEGQDFNEFVTDFISEDNSNNTTADEENGGGGGENEEDKTEEDDDDNDDNNVDINGDNDSNTTVEENGEEEEVEQEEGGEDGEETNEVEEEDGDGDDDTGDNDDDDDDNDDDNDDDDDDDDENEDKDDDDDEDDDDDDDNENDDLPEDNNVETRLQDFKVKLLRELEKLRKS